MAPPGLIRAQVDPARFNDALVYPYELRPLDFRAAMQDLYDFFFDVNTYLRSKGLERLDDMLRPANLSGVVTDMLTSSLAKHSRVLVVNAYPNGHPDLLVKGVHPNDAVKAGEQGVEIKTTRKRGGAVDMHGARDQCLSVFVYRVDNESEPVEARAPLLIREVYLGRVTRADFRRNTRGELGTPTSTLHRDGIAKLRQSWVYLDKS